MKDIEYYMSLNYKMVLIPDQEEGGYAVAFPDLPGCLTCADTLEKALENAEDCRRVWFEAMIEEGQPIPEPNDVDSYSGQFKLRLPKTLHKALADGAKTEGVSMNQYCVYQLTKAMGTSIRN